MLPTANDSTGSSPLKSAPTVSNDHPPIKTGKTKQQHNRTKNKRKSKRAKARKGAVSPFPPIFTAPSDASSSYGVEEDSVVAAEESSALELALRERNCSPDDEKQSWNEYQRRYALDVLERILNQWASSVQALRSTTTATAPAEDAQNGKANLPNVALITFGSYRLRVHRPDSDLDVLALSPPICQRGDFFTSLVKRLNDHPSIKDVHPISSAFTPVIKFLLNGLHIDLLFGSVKDSARLIEYQRNRSSPFGSSTTASACNADATSQSVASSTLESLPFPSSEGGTNQTTPFNLPPRLEYLIDDSDMAGMDAAGVRSLNGARVTQLLLEMVPHLEHYRLTLRAVKEWATMNGIYSNVLGFMGGVNFAILVAWVCMRNPKQQPTTLLKVFFRTFAMWHWPMPVILVPIQKQPGAGGESSLDYGFFFRS